MDPEILVEAAISALRARPPAGIDLADVNGFYARNRVALVEIVRRALPAPRTEPAFTRLTEEHRLARLVLDATRRHLEGSGPAAVSRELAGLLEGIDDHVLYENVTLFPYLRAEVPRLAPALDHAQEEHEILADLLANLVADLRAGRRTDGHGIEAMLHHLAEEETDIVALARAAGLTRTPPGNTGGLTARAAEIERIAAQLATATPTPASEPTRWGGRRGAEIPPAQITQGQRIVTEAGEHGIVTEVHKIVFTTLVGGRRIEDDAHFSITLRLDSGRVAIPRGPLYQERRGPEAVVPDLQIGQHWLAPSEVWSQTYNRYREISSYAEKAENARKPDMKAQWRRNSERARREFLELYRHIAAWRAAYPTEPVEGLREHLWRRLTLEAADPRTEDETWELAWLKRIPADWDTRWRVGDAVIVHVLGPYGRQPERGWTVQGIEGHLATLARGDEQRQEPLWMLKADDAAQPVAETFTEPRYLMEIAREMLVSGTGGASYPTRGAVARAVKTFLGEKGIAVSTHVRQGSMVTGIDLSPASGRWTSAEQKRLRELLPGLSVWSEAQGSFEPWETKGEDYDPYADYRGKGAGLVVPTEHVGRFAAILAGAMKAEGQPLNRLGEQRIAAGGPARAGNPVPMGNRGGATVEQRTQAAEGCRELDFDLPGYGHIRVVCGQEGRRDRWSNVFIGPTRYGYNGGRWARGQRPPVPVLDAIRDRGVVIFGT